MTAPVRIQATQQNTKPAWQTQFIMPEHSELNDLPQPSNQEVQLQEIPSCKIACIRFTGTWRSANFRKHRSKLKQWLQEHSLSHHEKAIYCYYNPPWSIPWLRRNEVMFQLINQAAADNQHAERND